MVASAGSRPARGPALTKYEVLEELGHGGMATVYRAHDKRLGRDVAIKVLHPHLRESREIAHRFEAEAKAVAKLRHRNIVEVFDVSSADEDEQYLVVEFVRGQTLRKLLQTAGALPPEVAAALAVELLGALAHAHGAGVVHRDVKPENVLLEHRSSGDSSSTSTPTPIPGGGGLGQVMAPSPSSGATSRRTPVDSNRGERIGVKLTDFGIAKLLDAQGVTSTGQVLGSPAHMAPEQIEGGDVDGRADVFGMGVLLYECMVGHLPFEGNNPAQVLRRVLDGIYPSAERERPSIGRIYSQILDRALARQAEDRYAGAEQMREALSAELLRLGVAAPRTELESYFDDPEGWSAENERRLTGKLCALGGDSRKRGDAVAAAADYNRALAYAPNDPQLLRIVASMHRAEARMRFVRRAGPLVLGTLALGASAFFVARALKGGVTVLNLPGVTSANTALLATGPYPSAQPSAKPQVTSPTPSERPTVALGTVRSPMTSVADAAAARKRSVTFASLQPQYGVIMKVDGVRGPDPGPGFSFMLPDEKPHALWFTCQDHLGNELCVSKTVNVPAGDAEQTLDVQLTILPAKLVVDGEPGRSYGIEEVPNITLASGVAAEIPMRAGQAAQTVVIFDRADPEKRKKQTLRAGQQHVVSFKNP